MRSSDFQSLAVSGESPMKRPRIMNTPPREEDAPGEPNDLRTRFVKATADLVSGDEEALTTSWERLLRQIQEEVKVVTQIGSDIFPVIDFKDIRYEDFEYGTSNPLFRMLNFATE